MESDVEVALAGKLRLLFPPSDEVFLTFPVAAAAFSQDDLDIFESEGEAAEDLRLRGGRKSQFARILNQIPRDSVAFDSLDRLLWDEYEQVLSHAVMAESVLTADERNRLDDARNLLTDRVEADGRETGVYSPMLVAYYQYKEEYEDFERTYLDEKATALASSDATVTATWESARRPELEAGRDKAMQDWLNLGYKEQVEAAQATVTALTGRDPQVRRLELLTEFEACRESGLDIAGDFLGTFYSPNDIFEPETAWTRLHLTRDEIADLLAGAPAELKGRSSLRAREILSVTVEYANVAIMRPWFDPSFLAMTSWRLPVDDPDVVSDGLVPRSGRIPAFITSMIVVRSVLVERLSTGPAPAKTPQFLSFVLRARLRAAPGGQSSAPRTGRPRGTGQPVPPVIAPIVVLRNATVDVKAQRSAIARVRPTSTVRVRRLAARPAVRDHRGAARTGAHDHRGAVTTPVRDHRGGQDPGVRDHPRETQVAVRPVTTVDEVDLDGVVVLAYRCRRVPRSPRPDPALDWGGDERGFAPAPAFPLPQGHAFGADRNGGQIHSGHADAADRAPIRSLQGRLVALGLPVDVDGYFGPQTAVAVTAMQRSRGISADGHVGAETWSVLWG